MSAYMMGFGHCRPITDLRLSALRRATLPRVLELSDTGKNHLKHASTIVAALGAASACWATTHECRPSRWRTRSARLAVC
jgi:hypothetical protein